MRSLLPLLLTSGLALAQAPKVPPSPAEKIEAAIRKELKIPPRELPKAKPEDFDATLPTDPDAATDSVPTLPPLPEGNDRPALLEQTAQQLRTAKDALAYYELFLADASTTDAEKEAAQSKLKTWQQAADDDLVRVGKRWLTRSEAEEIATQVQTLVGEAKTLLEKRDYEGASERLEKSARLDSEHLETQFLLGVAAYYEDDIALAERRFNICLSRAPESVPVLTNLGTCALLLKKYALAVRHWAKAAEREPTDATLMQNLDTFVADVKSRRLSTVEKRLADQANEAHARMVEAKAQRGDPKKRYVIATSLELAPLKK
jgi:tetratricopeptide (TPR) repeat protein